MPTTYALPSGADPFTVDDVRAVLGLATHKFDLLIQSIIGQRIVASGKPIVTRTMAVLDGESVYNEDYGWPVSVGARARLDGITDPRLFCICVYEPNPTDVETALKQIARRCLNEDDIADEISRERAAARDQSSHVDTYEVAASTQNHEAA